jgi:hypothetical protein
MRILDVSKTYESNFLSGHNSIFHESLKVAAQELGHNYSIAAPSRRVSAGDPFVGMQLSSTSWKPIAREVNSYLSSQPPTTVVVYEGSLSTIYAFKEVARQHPKHAFILNLFLREIPLASLKQAPTDAFKKFGGLEAIVADIPGNIRIFSDTSMTQLALRAIGLPVGGIWPHHSALAPPFRLEETNPEPNCVLVAASPAQLSFDRESLEDLSVAVDLVKRSQGLSFRMLGGVPSRGPLRGARRRLQSLPGASDGPLPLGDYARVMGAASLVWLPTQGIYSEQSSGKALDAMVAGRPVLAPAGTFGQREHERHVPGSLTYRNRQELREILEALPAVLGQWLHDATAAQHRAAAAYSPLRAVETFRLVAQELQDS